MNNKDPIISHTEHHICTITLNRPSVRNAFSAAMLTDLLHLSNELSRMSDVRAVVICGAGDKAFSAGADLKERATMTEKATLDYVALIQKTFHHIACLPMPTIAAINGDAFGGGLELALACDIRVLSKSAQVGLTEVSLGVIPGAGGTQRLPRLIGLSAAMDMIFQAKRIAADESWRIGLVNYLADDHDASLSIALEIATKIAQCAPLAVNAAKLALSSAQEKNLSDGLVAEMAAYHEIIETEDRKEGLIAFQQKRRPQFRGA